MMASVAPYFPVACYLNAMPRFRGSLLVVFFHLGAAFALWRRWERAVWAFLAFLLAHVVWTTLNLLFVTPR